MVAMVILACILRQFSDLRTVRSSARTVAALGVSSVVIAVNCGSYVWGVNNGGAQPRGDRQLIWLMATGSAAVGEYGAVHGILIAATGLITAIPLLCFSAAVTRISMTTLGLLQYVAPTVQFALGVLVFREPMPAIRLFGFILVWIALISFTVEMINHRHRQLKLAAGATSM